MSDFYRGVYPSDDSPQATADTRETIFEIGVYPSDDDLVPTLLRGNALRGLSASLRQNSLGRNGLP